MTRMGRDRQTPRGWTPEPALRQHVVLTAEPMPRPPLGEAAEAQAADHAGHGGHMSPLQTHKRDAVSSVCDIVYNFGGYCLSLE
jgi:hypothetical protein